MEQKQENQFLLIPVQFCWGYWCEQCLIHMDHCKVLPHFIIPYSLTF